jgi:hypothetical protein
MGTGEKANFIFKFYLTDNEGQVHIRQAQESRAINKQEFAAFIGRIKGI